MEDLTGHFMGMTRKWCRSLLPTCHWLELSYMPPYWQRAKNWNPVGCSEEKTWNWMNTLLHGHYQKCFKCTCPWTNYFQETLPLLSTLLLLSRPVVMENSFHSLLCWAFISWVPSPLSWFISLFWGSFLKHTKGIMFLVLYMSKHILITLG